MVVTPQLRNLKLKRKTQINKIACLKSTGIILFTEKIKEKSFLFIYLLILLCFWTIEPVRKSWFLKVQGTFS